MKKDKIKALSQWKRKAVPQEPPPQPPIIRMLDLPGMRRLEDDCLLYNYNVEQAPEVFWERVDKLTKKHMGVTRQEITFDWPDSWYDVKEDTPEYWEIVAVWREHEAQYTISSLPYDDRLEALKASGWDFTNERGDMLKMTAFLTRQVEAVNKGIAGHRPEIEIMKLDLMAAKMAREVELFQRSKRQRT